jgi:hypothetical protein
MQVRRQDLDLVQDSAMRELTCQLSDWVSNLRASGTAVMHDDVVSDVVAGATLDTAP